MATDVENAINSHAELQQPSPTSTVNSATLNFLPSWNPTTSHELPYNATAMWEAASSTAVITDHHHHQPHHDEEQAGQASNLISMGRMTTFTNYQHHQYLSGGSHLPMEASVNWLGGQYDSTFDHHHPHQHHHHHHTSTEQGNSHAAQSTRWVDQLPYLNPLSPSSEAVSSCVLEGGAGHGGQPVPGDQLTSNMQKGTPETARLCAISTQPKRERDDPQLANAQSASAAPLHKKPRSSACTPSTFHKLEGSSKEDPDTSNGSSEVGPALNTNGRPRAKRGSATDPQSVYARQRRERINERLKILQNLVPNGAKVDIVTMLEEAISYVKFLQLQVKLLSSDEYWMYAPTTYNGIDVSFDMLQPST